MQSARYFQSPYRAESLVEHKAGAVLTVCSCWLLTPAATAPLTRPVAATNHTRDLRLPWRPNIVFRTKGGLVPSAIDTESGLESAGLSVQAVFDDDLITEEAISNGDWDGASIEIFEVNYRAVRMGELVLFSGRLGTVKTIGRNFTAEAAPLTTLGRTKFGTIVRSRCDVREYGDGRCKLDIAPLTRTGTVDGVSAATAQESFVFAAAPTYTYTDGRVIVLSGANAGRRAAIKSYDVDTKTITLHYALPRPLAAGDSVTVIEGCNRTQAACSARGNILNYRGFPFITNIETVQRIVRAS